MRIYLIGIILSFSLLGQAQRGDFSMSGVVLNGQTGEPMKTALVTLIAIPDFSKATRQEGRFVPPEVAPPQTALTDIGGQFQFNGVAAGKFTLNFQKPGFVPAEPDNAVKQIELTASVTGIQLKLAPLGIVEGKVLDQYGDPIRRANIIAIQVRIMDGARVTSNSRSVATDDLGMYRLWNLAPGKYYLKAAGRSGGTYTYVGDNGPIFDGAESFAPVYSDGTRDLDNANPIAIGPGTQARVDFTLTLEPAVKIRGSLGNFVPHQTARFELLRGSEDVSASRVSLNGTTGRFEIQDVTPGTYLLRATQNEKTRGEASLTVGATDVNNVNLALSLGVTVRAELKMLGEVPQPQTQHNIHNPNASSCQISLRSTERSSDPNKQLQPSGQGHLTIGDVLPGIYKVQLHCFGGYAVSVLAGSTDLLANPMIAIQPGVAPPPIEIGFKPGGGTLKGKLTVDPLPKMGSILVVPLFSASTGPLLQPIWGENSKEFQIPSLAPGDYAVFAFSTFEDIEFRSQQFLRGLTGGIPVHIDEGGEKEIEIKAVVK
jgi:hypothetical protein